MENIKEMLTIKLADEISEKFHVDASEIKNIVMLNLDPYTLIEVILNEEKSDLKEKINFFIGVRRLDGLSDQTISRYRGELKLLSRYISKPVAEITTNDIRGYLSKIQSEKHLEKTTLNNKITILHTFFGFLQTEEIITKNPSLKLKTQKIDLKSLRNPLTVEELELLRDACKNIKEKIMVEFYYSTGCRISEGVFVRASAINWNERSILVHGKGDKDRTVYFSVKCKLLLKQYLSERRGNSDWLLTSERAPFQQLTKSGIERAIKRIASRTNITKSISPHVLRHTFATNALARGMSLEMIQQLLGHSNISTTQIYAETSQRAVRIAYEQFIAV